jgi:hypothetical protein
VIGIRRRSKYLLLILEVTTVVTSDLKVTTDSKATIDLIPSVQLIPSVELNRCYSLHYIGAL